MKKLWGLLFLAVPVGGVLFFVYSHGRWWFPENVSTFGGEIDTLFNLILWVTGIVFVLTEVALAWFLFKYSGGEGKATYLHGSHKLEMIWTAVPCVILLFITFSQMDTWKKVKFRSHFPATKPFAEVTAGQFEWRIRYAGPDAQLHTADDLTALNELDVPVNENILIHLKSRDVLHSFFLPHLRLKQDAVPGMSIPVWFNAVKADTYDLVCAELCGWGHYKMRGKLRVHPSRAAYDAWFAGAFTEQGRTR